MEDVVPQHQPDRVRSDEVRADREGLGQALGPGLYGVADRQAQLGSIPQQPLELRAVLRRCDDQYLPDPGMDQRRQRVVDHRLVVDGHQLLGHRAGDRGQAGARTAGQDDAFHGPDSNEGAC